MDSIDGSPAFVDEREYKDSLMLNHKEVKADIGMLYC